MSWARRTPTRLATQRRRLGRSPSFDPKLSLEHDPCDLGRFQGGDGNVTQTEAELTPKLRNTSGNKALGNGKPDHQSLPRLIEMFLPAPFFPPVWMPEVDQRILRELGELIRVRECMIGQSVERTDTSFLRYDRRADVSDDLSPQAQRFLSHNFDCCLYTRFAATDKLRESENLAGIASGKNRNNEADALRNATALR